MSDAVAAFAVLAWSAYLLSRVVRGRRVPELVAFLFAGAALGPAGLGVVTQATLDRLDVATQLALAVLMFVIGERVSRRALAGERALIIGSIVQFAAVAGLVTTATRAVGASPQLALLAGVLAGAGAPMTVSAIVSEHRSRGPFARRVVASHAMSDALAALAFAAALPLAALWSGGGHNTFDAFATFARVGAGSVVVGVIAGLFVARMSVQIETSGELLLFALVQILAVSTVALAAGLSLPITALTMGAVAASAGPEEPSARLFVAVRSVEQPLYLLFFALAGAAIHLDALAELGVIGLTYVAVRTLAKVVLGAAAAGLGGARAPDALRFGTSLIPQAGVAVGLAVLAAEALPGVGGEVAAVVLGSVVIFELVGPLLLARNLDAVATDVPSDEAAQPHSSAAPAVVLVASDSHVHVPEWLLAMCARSGAEIVALGPALATDEPVTALRQRAHDELVDFRWRGYGGESFAGAVTRAVEDIHADLVVVETTISAQVSRLALLPHERITRQVTCPVLVLPTAGAAPDIPRRPHTRRKARQRSA